MAERGDDLFLEFCMIFMILFECFVIEYELQCKPDPSQSRLICPTLRGLRKYDRGYLMVGSVGLYVLRQPVVSEGYLSAVYLATADWRGLMQQPLSLFGSLCRS